VQTIVVASQKGGVGKTTLCGHLAVEAERRGRKVALIDTDPQGGLAAWWNARQADTPAFFQPVGEGLRTTLDELDRAGFDVVLIDTPPAITASIAATVAAADLVLIPAKPSPHDLRAIGATVELVAAAGRPMAFVINQAVQRARLTDDARIALSEHGPVAPTILYHRVGYVSSMIDGRTAVEVDPRGEAAREMSELWAFLAGTFAGREMRHVTAAG
jgi:chromosome partitioning protein